LGEPLRRASRFLASGYPLHHAPAASRRVAWFRYYPSRKLLRHFANKKIIFHFSFSMPPDLLYLRDYLTLAEQTDLWAAINASTWLGDLKRRVQHYGYKYDYKARFIDYSMKIGSLPTWVQPIAERLYKDGYMPALPDQLIINEYTAGQGIAPHVDCAPCFGDTVVSISLGGTCVMDFTSKATGEKIGICLEPCSAVVLKGDARYLWTHGIAAKKSDLIDGKKTPRQTRISLTFRTVILQTK
jgi:alkylated DNA repair dioxygenase AlkB